MGLELGNLMIARLRLRAWRLVAVLIAVAAVLVAGPVSVAQADNTAPTLAFGAYPAPAGNQTRPQAVAAMEQKLGRRLAEVRVFQRWDDPWPDSYADYLKANGYPIILSVRAMLANGTPIKWADIANAAPGSALYNDILRWANGVKSYGLPVYFSFNQEPELEANLANGTAADFIAAWRKIVTVFRADDVSNARYMWIMTGYAFGLPTSDRRYAPNWYPGDAYVDAIGGDTYNWFTCRPGVINAWYSLQQLVEPQRLFGLAHPDKPQWLAEWASAEDPDQPGSKAAWYNQAEALFKQPGYQQFQGISIFNETYNTPTVKCAWSFDSSPTTAAAFIAMANDPFYAAPFPTFGSPPPNQPPTAVIATPHCVSLTCSFDGSTSSDPDGTVVSYAWTFGDGATSSAAQPSHTYATGGSYQVGLTVTDNDQATGATSTTVTVAATASSVTFIGGATSNRNALTHSVTVPAGVSAGNTLLLFDTMNNTTSTESDPTGLTGWTLVDTATANGMRTRLWQRAAQAGDAGAAVSVTVSAYSMVSLQLLAYSGAQNPIALSGSAVETVSRAGHTTPTLPGVPAGATLISYWADKTPATTSWTAPAGQTLRGQTAGSGAGHVSNLVTDSATDASGSAGGLTATASSADARATMWSLVLAPA